MEPHRADVVWMLRAVMCGVLGRLRHALLGWAGVLFYVTLAACGSADSTSAAREERQKPQEARIASAINSCPTFQFSLILPEVIHEGEIANVVAFASDPGSGESSIRYEWSATSGEFDTPHDPSSQYTCSDSGPQVLSVTASDREGCEMRQDFSILCAAP